MNKQQLPAYPLLTSDPYFSFWSPTDKLYESDVVHWTGAKKPILGIITIDSTKYRFLGLGSAPELTQTLLEITPTSTQYVFEGAGVSLLLTFTAPLLLDDLSLLSTPINYLDITTASIDGKAHDVSIKISFDEAHVYHGEAPQELLTGSHQLVGSDVVWLGKKQQTPLGHSGDNITIDWGYLHLALSRGTGVLSSYVENQRTYLAATFEVVVENTPVKHTLAIGYDDVLSIMYFGNGKKGYWAEDGTTLLVALEESLGKHSERITACSSFDKELIEKATKIGGEDYAIICKASYRQGISAHKLIQDDEGNPIFLSKECFSNGCIGTVDVSYPSIPLFLLYAPELVMAMMRPIFEFSGMPVWEYDFAPHDVGRYPYACGQVYGVVNDKEEAFGMTEGGVYPMLYTYPKGSDCYLLHMQMPVEECGNMLIMSAALARRVGNAEMLLPYMSLLEKWVVYLEKYGTDPGEQLCTDDFAGHLDHNINLSAKAIMGIEAYAQILILLGKKEESKAYHITAEDMAKSWIERATNQDEPHTNLTFEPKQGWSLKYNLVWDIFFQSNLFPQELFEKEIDWYIKNTNQFGAPLDSRNTYTKSDWLLWVSVLTKDKEKMKQIMHPVRAFLEGSPDRVPFPDWYDTKTGEHFQFQCRTVQSGVFLPLLKESGLL